MYAQANLSLHWLFILEDMFSHIAADTLLQKFTQIKMYIITKAKKKKKKKKKKTLNLNYSK